MSRQNVEIVRRTLEVFAQEGTAGSFEGLVTDDVQLRPAFEVAGGATFVGVDGFELFLRQWTENFDDWALQVGDLLDAGDAVVARLHQSGRGKGSGAPVELLFGMVFRLRDGEVEQMEVFVNADEALKAVGLDE